MDNKTLEISGFSPQRIGLFPSVLLAGLGLLAGFILVFADRECYDSAAAADQAHPGVAQAAAKVDYAPIVKSAARRHGLDPRLIHAIIRIESKGDAGAVSPKGAKGLMQITALVCRQHGVDDPFDARQNIHAGSAHMAYLLKILNGNLEYALAAYNCGLEKVIRHDGVPPLKETREFVRSVLSQYRPDLHKKKEANIEEDSLSETGRKTS